MAILNNEEGNNTSKIYGDKTQETNRERLARLLEEWENSKEATYVQNLIELESKKGIGNEVIKIHSPFTTQVQSSFQLLSS